MTLVDAFANIGNVNKHTNHETERERSMSDFKPFSQAVTHAFNTMIKKDDGKKMNLFNVDITGDELYAAYLGAFPEGTNPMFRERTEHDCSCCRNFIKNIGGVVYSDGKVVHTVWDSVPEGVASEYKIVANALSELVKSKAIKSAFYVGEPSYGAATTKAEDGTTWNHFYAAVPRIYLMKHNTSNVVGMRNDDVAILKRSVTEITDAAVEIVEELMDQGSLYRGDEHKGAVKQLKQLKTAYNKLKTDRARELWLWTTGTPQTRIRNTVIGTLLTDLSDGKELEAAVGSFEAKVAPANFKRPKALVTQKMIDSAKKVVDQLGIEDSLQRRYAVKEDISVNDILFVDGSVKPKLLGGAFDAVKPTKAGVVPELKNVESINVEDFINNVLPKANEVELFVKSAMANSFVSLVAPVIADAAPLMKWDNAFSWSYDGEVTDSIKERVKRAGGKVDGDVRVSLSWHNGDDLDLSIGDGTGMHSRLYFGNRRAFGAELDVDMNCGYGTNSVDPVENIFWGNRNNMRPGTYDIQVHNWAKRSTANVGFEIEIDVMGKTYSFAHHGLSNSERVTVGKIVVDKSGNIEVQGKFTEGGIAFEKWGIKTEQWVAVDMVMRSPNFWGGKQTGNQHVFFMLKDCVNPEGTRGFYNEFLRDDLTEHRKVFELLSSSLKVAPNDNQLSGVGISTTKKEEILVRVKGSINRVLNVTF